MVDAIKKIDINRPDYSFSVSKCKRSASIHRALKHFCVEQYAYIIECEGKAMKIGQSADSSRIYGERLIRQLGNLPGWPPEEARKSGCGKDILSVTEDFQKATGITVHKDNCTVKIWDVTHIPIVAYNQRHPSVLAEDELMTQYEQQHGRLPIGNYKDTRPKYKPSLIRIDVVKSLFEFG